MFILSLKNDWNLFQNRRNIFSYNNVKSQPLPENMQQNNVNLYIISI